jgi:hypothetical protein
VWLHFGLNIIRATVSSSSCPVVREKERGWTALESTIEECEVRGEARKAEGMLQETKGKGGALACRDDILPNIILTVRCESVATRKA